MRHLACVVGAQGRRAEAINLLEQVYAISRESGITFSGPSILGALAVVTDDPGKRRWALDEGETILGRGCVFHNCFWFYRHGMEASLEEGDWDRVERYAAALERFTQEEPVPWTRFFVARGRALAAYGRGKRDRGTLGKIRRLQDEADRACLRTASLAFERVLGAA